MKLPHLLKRRQASDVRLALVIETTVFAGISAGEAVRVLFHVFAELLTAGKHNVLLDKRSERRRGARARLWCTLTSL